MYTSNNALFNLLQDTFCGHKSLVCYPFAGHKQNTHSYLAMSTHLPTRNKQKTESFKVQKYSYYKDILTNNCDNVHKT